MSYKKTITLGLDYTEFTGGIKECNAAMKKLDSEYAVTVQQMEKGSSASEKLGQKQEYLTKKIEVQSQKVTLAKEKYDELVNSHANVSAIDKAAVALNKETASLEKMKNEMIDTAIESSNVEKAFTALAAVVATVGAALIKVTAEAAEYADEMQTLSDQTGIGVTNLQVLGNVAELIDTDLTTVTNSFKKLESNMASSPEKFRELGVEITNSSGSMRDAEDVFWEVIDALGEIENATEQDQQAMEIFGKSAAELTGVINMGSDGFREYKQNAIEMGTVLSGGQISALTEMGDAVAQLKVQFQSAGQIIAASFAPAVTAVVNALNRIPAPVLAAIAVVGSLVAIIGTLAVTINAIITVFSSLGGILAVAGAGFAASTAPILAVIAVITALIAVIYLCVEAYKNLIEMQSQLSDMSGEDVSIGETLRYTFTGSTQKSEQSQNSLVKNAFGNMALTTSHFANGTNYAGGGLAWVGENGPELVNIPTGSQVYTNEESQGMMGNTYNITMNCDLSKLKSVSDVVDAVSGLGNSRRAYA